MRGWFKNVTIKIRKKSMYWWKKSNMVSSTDINILGSNVIGYWGIFIAWRLLPFLHQFLFSSILHFRLKETSWTPCRVGSSANKWCKQVLLITEFSGIPFSKIVDMERHLVNSEVMIYQMPLRNNIESTWAWQYCFLYRQHDKKS